MLNDNQNQDFQNTGNLERKKSSKCLITDYSISIIYEISIRNVCLLNLFSNLERFIEKKANQIKLLLERI